MKRITILLLTILMTISLIPQGTYYAGFAYADEVVLSENDASAENGSTIQNDSQNDTQDDVITDETAAGSTVDESGEKEDKAESTQNSGNDMDKESGTQDSESSASSDAKKSGKTANTESKESVTDTSAPEFCDGVLEHKLGDLIFTVSYEKSACIPEGTELEVKELSSDSDSKKDREAYSEYHDLSLDELKNGEDGENVAALKFSKFFDIKLMYKGKEIEPADTVNVNISFEKKAKEQIGKDTEENLKVVHLTEDEEGELKAEVLDTEDIEFKIDGNKLEEASFNADSFSVYGIVYTVDFEYNIKQVGKTGTVAETKCTTFRMEAAYDSDAGIPAEGVHLSAMELEDDDPDTITFDIKIVSDSDEHVVYQPAEGHNVALTVVVMDDKADADVDTASVLHVCEDGTEEMLTADLEATDEGYVYSFDTKSFSTFTLYRTGTNSSECFITTVKTGRFGGYQTELSGSARIDNNNKKGWLSFEEVITKWNQNYSYTYSNGRYSVLIANDSGGNTHQALCAIGFFNANIGLASSNVALGRFATAANVNGSASSYDLQVELNDNSLPVRITANGTTTDTVFVPLSNATRFTPKAIAEELGYNTAGMAVSGKIDNASVDSVSRAQLTTTDIPTVSSGSGWWSRLLAGETFNFSSGNTVIAAVNTVSYPATNVSYPAAYKWTYSNNGAQTVIGDKAYEINLIIPIARVSNDGGSTWTYHSQLIGSDQEGGVYKGAFDQANSLDGDVIIELLKKGDADGTGANDDTKLSGDTVGRYTLTQGFTFNNNNNITLCTTQDSEWNADGFTSVITRGFDGEDATDSGNALITVSGSTMLRTEDIIFEGNGHTGRAISNLSDELTIGGGTQFHDFNSPHGGAVYSKAGSTLTIGEADKDAVVFTNCTADIGGAVYFGGYSNFEYHNEGAGTLNIVNTTFGDENDPAKACSATEKGGAVYTLSSTMTVTDSEFYGKGADTTVAKEGGAICSLSNMKNGMTLTDCTFKGIKSSGA